ncbi:hypothetical protein OQI_13010 [Streptomyces pharetrae CZA14]|uniref:Secreted protein n=1 Tax=Streptomyces pharetrae CZA14 TaxID=1144883 RepID=A0ABX3YKM2_9ACTN|nr:hypothetical protein OQI_13010 [Streptomyces pharetrae CZA14]
MQVRKARSIFAGRSALAKRRSAFTVAAAGAALALAMSGASPAAAAAPDACTAYGCYTGDGWGSGFGRWEADGDKMWVCDRHADGYSVVVLADIGGVSQSKKWHTGGAGSCTERSYGDVREGQTIEYQACLGDYSEGTIRPGSCGNLEWSVT